MIKVSFIGTGYVGLVSGACIADFNHQVICMDMDKNKIKDLNNGKIPIYEPGLSELVNKNVKEDRLKFTTNLEDAISNSDIIFIAVGTPSDVDGRVDMKYIYQAINNISKYIKSYKIIVIKSTVPPGTASEVKSILNKNKLNEDLYDVVSNPEFLREGSAIKDFMIPDRIVIGSLEKKAIDKVKSIYQPMFLRDIPLVETNHETAELIKYSTNAFLATKITFINEISLLCRELNADVNTISTALGLDGRISPKFLHPGPGFGGSCFPKDVLGLFNLMISNKINGNLISSVLKTNNEQKELMFSILKKYIKDLKGKKISVLGLAFKPNTDDVRESASIVIIEKLLSEGAVVYGYDPEGCENMKKIFPQIVCSTDLNETLIDSNGAILITEWNSLRSLNAKKVGKLMKDKVFIDCRNIFNSKDWTDVGFIFENLGRIE